MKPHESQHGCCLLQSSHPETEREFSANAVLALSGWQRPRLLAPVQDLHDSKCESPGSLVPFEHHPHPLVSGLEAGALARSDVRSAFIGSEGGHSPLSLHFDSLWCHISALIIDIRLLCGWPLMPVEGLESHLSPSQIRFTTTSWSWHLAAYSA